MAGFSTTGLVGASASHDAISPRIFTYYSSTDTLATAAAANYFLDPRIRVGDLIIARCTDQTAIRQVTATSYSASTSTTTPFTGSTVIKATATWNPASLIDGAGETSSSFTATGAAFGDTVAVAAPYDLAGCTVTGYVDAADSVKVRIQNESGSTVDLASGTWAVYVTKR